MKQMDKQGARADRRSFLKLAGAGVVGSGAALATAAALTPAEASSDAVAEGTTYRETDHVKRYYELAKFI